MRKFLGALMLCALLAPLVAEAQLPRPSLFEVRQVKWRISVAAVNANGYVDSTAHNLAGTGAASCTTQAIPTDEMAFWSNTGTVNGPGNPQFMVWSPNTSTADSLAMGFDVSFDGTTWIPHTGLSTGLGGVTGTASETSPMFKFQLHNFGGHVANQSTAALGPFPFYRVFMAGTSGQAFSAAQIQYSYLSWRDGTGNGQAAGRWKTVSVAWNCLNDSTQKNLDSDDVDTTAVISLSDVDWFPPGGNAAQGWGRLVLWSDKATAANDSIYYVCQVAPTRSGPWSEALAPYVITNGHVLPFSTQIACLGLTGPLINSTPGSNVAHPYLMPFCRFLIRPGDGATMAQARIAFQYPTRNPN